MCLFAARTLWSFDDWDSTKNLSGACSSGADSGAASGAAFVGQGAVWLTIGIGSNRLSLFVGNPDGSLRWTDADDLLRPRGNCADSDAIECGSTDRTAPRERDCL